MPRVPRVSGAELVRRLEQLGYMSVRTIGSHARLRHPHRPPTTVPLHDVIGPGLLRKILRDTGLSRSDLFADWTRQSNRPFVLNYALNDGSDFICASVISISNPFSLVLYLNRIQGNR